MPDKKSDKKNPEAEESSGGGSKRVIVMGVLCAVIAGAGFVLGGRLSGGDEAVAEVTEEVAEEELPTETIDEIVELNALNVNLADGHYLRLAVAIGISHHADEHAEDSGGGHGATDDTSDEPSIPTAPAADLVLTTFAGRSMAVLATPEGREAARHDLHEGLEAFYGEAIVTVLFTEFVMQ